MTKIKINKGEAKARAKAYMRAKRKVTLGKLSIEDVQSVAIYGAKVSLNGSVVKKIERAHEFLKDRIDRGEILYGVNTGFGLLSSVSIDEGDLEQLQINILRSHAAGVGNPIEDKYVRAMLLLRANALALGHSGVSVKLVRQIVDMLNRGVLPVIPEQGSVGASGDLAPLAHLGLVLIGEGRARYHGKEMSGKAALRAAKMKPIRLGPKEGLALINGTQFMTAIGALCLVEAEHLLDVADLAGALTVEALRGTSSAFLPEIHDVRPHPGQVLVARRLRRFLKPGSTRKSQIAKSHENCGRVQDPYSLRCIPQVHGASRDLVSYVRQVIAREINAVTDNPLVFTKTNRILSGGNFHGQTVALAMDSLSMAVAELGNISEQRLEKLMNPAFSDLPAFLSPNSGLNSGFMLVQVVAASIVSENKTLCHPASVDSIPTSADKEDHVSMGAWAARKAANVVANVRRVIAMEVLAACQGLDLLAPLETTNVLASAHRIVRKEVPPLHDDRVFTPDIEAITQMIEDYQFSGF